MGGFYPSRCQHTAEGAALFRPTALTKRRLPYIFLPAAPSLLLDRRALNRAKRTEHAAVTRIWPQECFTVIALVEILAGVRGHGFLLMETAVWADQY